MREKTIRFTVAGRVQGVGFRAWTAERARALGLAGWVRNEAEGTVTGLARGAADTIAAFERALHEGPPGAAVVRVDVQDADDEASPSGIDARPVSRRGRNLSLIQGAVATGACE